MERYYKTIRDSKTALKIKALIDKADEFDKQVAVLREKYGFSKTWTSSFYYRSLDIVEFTEEPDMANWKRMKDAHMAIIRALVAKIRRYCGTSPT